MNGHRSGVGLSLLSTIVFCALMAPDAHALKGTTVYVCSQAAQVKKEFQDAHCNVFGPPNTYGHKEVPVNFTTETQGTNAKTSNETTSSTNSVLKGTLGGVAVSITCTTLSTHGSVENVVVGGQMSWQGFSTTSHTGCSTTVKKCTVKEPIVWEATTKGQVNAAEEMWVEFKGKGAEETLAEVTFEGAECLLKGTFPVKGTAIATPNGATFKFEGKEPKSTVKLGPNAAEYVGVHTVICQGGSEALVLTTQAS